MTFSQITWRWDNWAGGPGFTTFRMFGDLDNAQTDAAAAAQRTFLASQAPYIPTIITLSCDTIVKVYADGDGSLIDQRTIATAPSTVVGTGAGNFSAVTGSCIVWRTQQSSGRRMLMGRTFLVPLGTTAFTTGGILSVTYLNATGTALGTYIGRVAANVNGHPVIWHRPKGDPPAGGYSASVTGATVNKSGAELRRRRD